MQGGAPERHQDTRHPGQSRHRSRTPPPAAGRVVFHEGMDRGYEGPDDPPAQQTSSAADPRRQSKRPRTERTHIPTIPVPAERARQAPLQTGPHQATDGASSSSAASLSGPAAGPLPEGRHAADTRPMGPAADQRPEQGVGGRTPQSPPTQAGGDGTGPRHGHWPPRQLGPYATGRLTPAAMQPNRRGAEDAPQQRGHDADDPGEDQKMAEASGPQKSSSSPPTTASCSMSPGEQPSRGNVPEGHLDTSPGHPCPTGTTPDQDRETMPPTAPRPPQRRSTDFFDEAEMKAVRDIHANKPSCGLVAALREHLHNVHPNRLFAVVPLPYAASTDISVRQLQALVTPRIADRGLPCRRMDLVVQHQPAGPGRRMGPAPGLGTHAHSATDRPQARAQHGGPGTGRPTTESQRPQHPTVQLPGRIRKQDIPRPGAQPQGSAGAVPTRGGDGTRRTPATRR